MKKTYSLFIVLLLSLIFTGCVSQKEYDDLKEENALLKSELKNCGYEIDENKYTVTGSIGDTLTLNGISIKVTEFEFSKYDGYRANVIIENNGKISYDYYPESCYFIVDGEKMNDDEWWFENYDLCYAESIDPGDALRGYIEHSFPSEFKTVQLVVCRDFIFNIQ